VALSLFAQVELGAKLTPKSLDLAERWLRAKNEDPKLGRATFCARVGESIRTLENGMIDPERRAREHAIVARFKNSQIEERLSAAAAVPPVTPLKRAEKEKADVRLRREHKELVEQLKEANERERVRSALADFEPKPIKRREIKSGKREATAVAMLSDTHVEETATLEQSGGVNVYNLEIAEESMHRFFDGARWMNALYRETFGVRDMVLAIMGDLMTGYIHEELVESNALSPIETCLWLHTRVTAGIRHLLADNTLERLIVPCVPGNHGRTTSKIRRQTYAENSYEWLLYQQLAHEFRDDPRVEFVVDKAVHKWVAVYDQTVHIHHGDELKYQGGVGGLAIPLGKRVPIWDRIRRADVHLLGHFHQFRDFNNAVVNGSMVGYGAYAMSIGAPPEPPQQGYFLLDSKRGKTCVSPIWVRK
jgi:hypothetical protein